MHNTPCKTPFIGFLLGIKSAQHLYKTLVDLEALNLKYLLTYKMSQDHLELFFCAIRSSLECNNSPTDREFSTLYRKLLVRHEIKGIGGELHRSGQDNNSLCRKWKEKI